MGLDGAHTDKEFCCDPVITLAGGYEVSTSSSRSLKGSGNSATGEPARVASFPVAARSFLR